MEIHWRYSDSSTWFPIFRSKEKLFSTIMSCSFPLDYILLLLLSSQTLLVCSQRDKAMNEDSHSKLGQLYLRRNVKANISIQSEELLSNQTYESDLAFRNQHRRLQFDGKIIEPIVAMCYVFPSVCWYLIMKLFLFELFIVP